jgi:ankyrin repeat protein
MHRFRFCLALLVGVGAPTQALAAEIHEAAREGDLERMEVLVAEDPGCVGARTDRGTTPLHYACLGDDPRIVAFLLSKGADVNARNSGHHTSLHFAAARDQPEMVALLIDHGADVGASDREGETPLHQTAYNACVRSARVLIERGADVHHRNTHGRTPFVLTARESGDVPLARLLLAAGSDLDSVDESGDGALELSAWRGFHAFLSFLLESGARIPDSEPKRISLLRHSVKRRLDNLLDALVAADLDLTNVRTSHPDLILEAASGGSCAIVGRLVEKGFDPRFRDDSGWTPLHGAAEFGRDDVIRRLLDGGADVNARTVLGQTPFNIAQEEGNEKTAALLRNAGAETDAPRFPGLQGAYLGQDPPGDVPELFAPGIVMGHFALHSSVAFAPDGKTAFWRISIPPRESGYGSGRMLGTTVEAGRWTYPTQPDFEGGDVPFFSPDGEKLYFLSRRPIDGQGGKERIWVVCRTEDGWSEPEPFDAVLNAAPMHWQFSVDREGTFYLGSGDGRILVSRHLEGRYENPVEFSELYGNDSVQGGCPYVSPDGSYLIFTRDDDLHITFRRADGSWTEAQNLGDTINSPTHDLCPLVTPDGRYMIYLTTRDGRLRPYWVAIEGHLSRLEKGILDQ